jgi:hypothetical protein
VYVGEVGSGRRFVVPLGGVAGVYFVGVEVEGGGGRVFRVVLE